MRIRSAATFSRSFSSALIGSVIRRICCAMSSENTARIRSAAAAPWRSTSANDSPSRFAVSRASAMAASKPSMACSIAVICWGSGNRSFPLVNAAAKETSDNARSGLLVSSDRMTRANSAGMSLPSADAATSSAADNAACGSPTPARATVSPLRKIRLWSRDPTSNPIDPESRAPTSRSTVASTPPSTAAIPSTASRVAWSNFLPLCPNCSIPSAETVEPCDLLLGFRWNKPPITLPSAAPPSAPSGPNAAPPTSPPMPPPISAPMPRLPSNKFAPKLPANPATPVSGLPRLLMPVATRAPRPLTATGPIPLAAPVERPSD